MKEVEGEEAAKVVWILETSLIKNIVGCEVRRITCTIGQVVVNLSKQDCKSNSNQLRSQTMIEGDPKNSSNQLTKVTPCEIHHQRETMIFVLLPKQGDMTADEVLSRHCGELLQG